MTSQVRGDAKREAIIRASLGVFLEGGFLGTNVDDIAAAARASKRTVYSHFGDKEGLFREVIRSTIAPMQAALQEQLDLVRNGDPWESLRAVTRELAMIVVTPELIRLRRVISAEADRFPDLAAEWYRLGPEQSVDRLSEWLATSGLPIADPRTAAEQLVWLVVSAPLNRLMFARSGQTALPGELERASSSAYELFRLAYASPDRPSSRYETRKENDMSFQAYLDTIERKTGLTPRELLDKAAERGFQGSAVKAGDVVDWLAKDYGLGRGHAMALVHVIKNGPTAPQKHVGSTGTHRDESHTLWLDGVATKP